MKYFTQIMVVLLIGFYAAGCATVDKKLLAKRDAAYAEGIKLYNRGEIEAAHKKFTFVAKVDKKSWERDEVSSKQLNPFFGKKKFMEITPDEVATYKNKRMEEIQGMKKNKGKSRNEISFSTISRELALMKTLYNWHATQKKSGVKNPVNGIKLPETKSRNRIMSIEEEKLFFSKGKPAEHLKNIVVLALYTGMRRDKSGYCDRSRLRSRQDPQSY